MLFIHFINVVTNHLSICSLNSFSNMIFPSLPYIGIYSLWKLIIHVLLYSAIKVFSSKSSSSTPRISLTSRGFIIYSSLFVCNTCTITFFSFAHVSLSYYRHVLASTSSFFTLGALDFLDNFSLASNVLFLFIWDMIDILLQWWVLHI